MKGVVPQVIDSMNREVLNDLALTKAIKHPGESGRARELILTGFLKRLVPEAFGVSTGFVIDVHGGISRQVDIVVYRNDYHPVFKIGGVDHFIVESVAAVIEVKATIKDRQTLHQSLENIASVKSLDRTGGGANYLVPETNLKVDPDGFGFQVFGAIVTESSMEVVTVGSTVAEFISSRPRNLWPNIYVDVHEFTGTYKYDDGIGVVPALAKDYVLWVSPREWPPLVELAYELVNFLRITPRIDFDPRGYFGFGNADNLIGFDIGSTATPTAPDEGGATG